MDGKEYHSSKLGEWEDSQGKTVYTPFDQAFHLIVNLAVGGKYDNMLLPPSEYMPASFEIDWIRVYQ